MKKLEKFLTEELGLNASDYMPAFKEFERCLLKWNSKINLVSRNTVSIEEHILNSVFFLTKVSLETSNPLADVGSGGGFPGMPLKILFSDLRVTMIDSIRKKALAVRSITDEMNLENIEYLCARAELLSGDTNYRAGFGVITAKAVAPLAKLFEWTKDLLLPEGRMIFIKGGDMRAEIEDLLRVSAGYSVDELTFSFDNFYNINDKKIFVIKKIPV